MNHSLDLFLLFYEDLIQDPSRALVKLAYFLGVDLSPRILQCALDNQDGVFHRNKSGSPLEGMTLTNMEHISKGLQNLKDQIHVCLQQRACMTSGCHFLFL